MDQSEGHLDCIVHQYIFIGQVVELDLIYLMVHSRSAFSTSGSFMVPQNNSVCTDTAFQHQPKQFCFYS